MIGVGGKGLDDDGLFGDVRFFDPDASFSVGEGTQFYISELGIEFGGDFFGKGGIGGASVDLHE